MYCKKYTFIKDSDGMIISANDIYETGKEAGFLNFIANQRLMNHFTGTGGWNSVEERKNAVNTQLINSTYGVEVHEDGMPLRFRVSVPQKGVYAVTVTIEGGETGITGMKLYSGRRNLVKCDIIIAPGEHFSYRYLCSVCEYIPVVGEPAELDSSIYVSAMGKLARLSSVSLEYVEAPTLFIAGDSLVADYDGLYPYNPMINGGSWGQNLLQYFDKLAISNQAHGGLTSNCFREDGHWDIIRKNIRPGDAFMMEFGHNDQKRRNLKPFDQYAANIRWYISQVRKLGGYPIIVTSLSRIPELDEGGYYDLLEDYALSCHRIGRECSVPVIDLHEYSFQRLCEMDKDVSKNYFKDTTHTNDFGALEMAEFIAMEIKRQQIAPLCSCMNACKAGTWIPDESLKLTKGLSGADKEESPILSTKIAKLPYEDCKNIPQREELEKAMALGLLDPCIKFFHPFAEMPRGQFLYVFFKGLKRPIKRTYEGKYCDIYKYEFDAQNVQAAIDMGLIDESTTTGDRFRPDDGLTGGELVSFMIRSLYESENQTMDINKCEELACKKEILWDGYKREEMVNRAECITALVRLRLGGQ